MRCAAVFLERLQVPQSRLPRHVTAFLGTMPPQTVHFLPLGGKCLQRHTDNVDSLTAYFAPSSIRLISPASYSRRIASLCSTENFETMGEPHDLSSFSKSKSLSVNSPASTLRPIVRLSMKGDRSNTLPRSMARMTRIGSRAFLASCNLFMTRLSRKNSIALSTHLPMLSASPSVHLVTSSMSSFVSLFFALNVACMRMKAWCKARSSSSPGIG